MTYLWIADWEQHRHYRDRLAVWIKCHLSLLNDYRFTRLPDAAKGQLLALKLLGARDSGRLPNDPKWLAQQIGATDDLHLEKLIAEGFLLVEQPASKMLQSEIATRKEGRKEGDQSGNQKGPTKSLAEILAEEGISR